MMCVYLVESALNLSCVDPAADVGDIQSRVLDHKPVINAEIRYFVKEFEVLSWNADNGPTNFVRTSFFYVFYL